jgi:hypothetical protein
MPSPPRFACPELVENRNSGSKTTQPSRFPGLSSGRDLGRSKNRVQTDGVAGERVGSTLLAVDDADGAPALEPGIAQGPDRGHRSAARRDDVLDGQTLCPSP